MRSFLKNYKFPIILLSSIIIGSIIGIIFGSDAKVLKPLGDLYINLMFVIIIPLIFLTISTAISKMKAEDFDFEYIFGTLGVNSFCDNYYINYSCNSRFRKYILY